MSTREEKAVAAELAKFRAAGWTVLETPRPAAQCQPFRPVPPRAEWLPAWRRVFKESQR